MLKEAAIFIEDTAKKARQFVAKNSETIRRSSAVSGLYGTGMTSVIGLEAYPIRPVKISAP